MFSESKTTLETGLFNVPDRALITPLAEGSFALALANGVSWAGRYLAGPENALLLRAIDDLFARQSYPYNPLVLHGPSGVGKSHLAHGIARRFAAQNPAQTPLCESGSDFALGYAAAVESRSVPAWREARRAAPLLVLDGVHQLADRAAAQIELLHTIDALLDAGNILVVTAQQSPRQIAHLLPGLVSRLSAGLSISIAKPAAATRRSMLERMAAERELVIDDDALRLLAERLDSTMPELAGALHALTAEAQGRNRARLDRAAIVSYLGTRPAARVRPRCATSRRTRRGITRCTWPIYADPRGGRISPWPDRWRCISPGS